MHLQLWRGIAHGCQCGDGCDFPCLGIEPGPAVNVAEGKFEQIGREVRCDIGERRNYLFSGLTINLSEYALAAFQPGFA